MPTILLIISIMSGGGFLISNLIQLNSKEPVFNVFLGAIFTVAIWKYVLALGIIGLVLSSILLIINIMMFINENF